MSTLIFEDGSYNLASGTRDAFGQLSDALVREGFPAMRVTSGDREHSEQVNTFVSRFRQQASGAGPYGDVRVWDGAADGYPGGTRWVRFSGAGTVAPPGSSDHERRRSNDLKFPYNSSATAAHVRARQLAKNYSVECDGLLFGEAWHWTNKGALGAIGGSTAGTTATPFPTPETKEDDDMKDLIKIVGFPVDKTGGPQQYWIMNIPDQTVALITKESQKDFYEALGVQVLNDQSREIIDGLRRIDVR